MCMHMYVYMYVEEGLRRGCGGLWRGGLGLAALVGQVRKHLQNVHAYGGLRLADTTYSSWKELVSAVKADGHVVNADMRDDPLLPALKGEKFDLKQSLSLRQLSEMLAAAVLQLGYEPNCAGWYSLRKYCISTVVATLGYHQATRKAQHADVSQPTVNAVYDADDASNDTCAGNGWCYVSVYGTTGTGKGHIHTMRR